jgi:DNA processing protein
MARASRPRAPFFICVHLWPFLISSLQSLSPSVPLWLCGFNICLFPFPISPDTPTVHPHLLPYLRLSLTSGLGPILLNRLLTAAGSPGAAAEAPASLLRTIEGIGQSKAPKIAASLRASNDEADKILARCAQLNLSLLCPADADYPPLLRPIPDPPAVLYLRGRLEPRDLHALAIVGSRKCSHYGREQAERFAAILSAAGMTVVSGGARGIDSAAHRGALSHPDGRTLAVLGSGLDIAYPPENAPLFDQIANGRGAVLSEFPPGTPPIAENFPRRNRIVSGLSRGVLVIEADVRSGALITARQANEEQGRTVFALPGRVDNPLSIGPHQLIRDGATLVTQLTDILDDLPPVPDNIDAPALADASHDDTPLFDPAQVEDHAPGLPGEDGLSAPQRAISLPSTLPRHPSTPSSTAPACPPRSFSRNSPCSA